MNPTWMIVVLLSLFMVEGAHESRVPRAHTFHNVLLLL